MKTLQLDLTQQQQTRVQQLQKQSDVFQEEVKRLKKNLEQKETLLEFKVGLANMKKINGDSMEKKNCLELMSEKASPRLENLMRLFNYILNQLNTYDLLSRHVVAVMHSGQ